MEFDENTRSPSVFQTLGDKDTDIDSEAAIKIPQVADKLDIDGKTDRGNTNAPWVNLFKDNMKIEEGFEMLLI